MIAEFRAAGGRVGGYFAGMPLLLLTTIGSRSGRSRTVALTYMAEGARYVVVAADAGRPTDPAWYRNLLANPAVTVEVGIERFEATARVAEGEEREGLLSRFTAEQPQLTGYRARTNREMPVVVLIPGAGRARLAANLGSS